MGRTTLFNLVEGSVVAPKGFRASGIFCDIKRLGTGKGSNKGQKRDLGLIVSEVPAAVAGMFTTSQVCAAPVKVSVKRVAGKVGQGIVVNSGNANACTGKQGLRDAQAMTELAGRRLGIATEHVLVCSTGRIGVNLPMSNVTQGIMMAADALGNSVAHGGELAEAIMTSDTRPKQIAVEFKLGRKVVRIGGVCKGAGMIQPGMSPTGARPATSGLHATMLGFITTDAAIPQRLLQQALEVAVALSFNRITVDGDMSTNDTVLLLANGLAENGKIAAGSADFRKFQAALNHVCLELARMIVRDGEGVTRFVTVTVKGARSVKDAEAAARAVANSSLVKTSWFGGDPNWGRILGALGYSEARIVEEKIDVAYSVPGKAELIYALKKGQPTDVAFGTLVKLVSGPEFTLHIFLNVGKEEATIYTCDLTEEYVDFNKGDVTDPASLGG
ncbi:MAG: bifunctional glutamate N-acetyltransferase/amino-acid acetyltransferase ArgJ [Verrucomicrobiota bacterium]|nr:bifunctional glutamate N-acetyltransferase/amino-acid acetyltransferase ArgJ [Verrucomicrobiota bacterium]